MHRSYIIMIAAAAAPLACTFALKTTENQCSTDQDCVHRGGPMATAVCRNEVCVGVQPETASPTSDGTDASASTSTGTDWSCLGKVSWPSPPKPQVAVSMQFIDLVTKTPVANIAVRPCAKLDVNCANPLGAAVKPDDSGMATLTVPASFDGYAEVLALANDANASATGIVPMNVFFNPPPANDLHYGIIPTFMRQELLALAAMQGNTVDSSLGFLFSGALDCKGKPAAGVSWEPDRSVASTRRFYYVDGLPSEAAVATDATGYGGFINMPTGTIRLFSKLQATGQTVGNTSVFVRAGYLTTGFLVPTP